MKLTLLIFQDFIAIHKKNTFTKAYKDCEQL